MREEWSMRKSSHTHPVAQQALTYKFPDTKHLRLNKNFTVMIKLEFQRKKNYCEPKIWITESGVKRENLLAIIPW